MILWSGIDLLDLLHTLVLCESVEQFADGLAQPRVNRLPVDLRKRDQDELTLVHSGMGNLEHFGSDDLFVEEEKIEIDLAGPPGKGLSPSKRDLDRLDGLKELKSIKFGLDLDDLIDERVL